MWVDGEKKIVDPPFWPYFIVKNHAIEWEKVGEYRAERVVVKPITTLEPIPAMKYSFPSVAPIQQLNFGYLKQLEKEGKSPVVENHLRFIERVAVDAPDFFRQYPNKKNDILCFDIETLTENHVPKDNIIAIAISDGEEIFYEDVTGGTSEAYLLEWFKDNWSKIDPDHVIGYNHKGFDIPRILKRCIQHNIPINWVGRDNETPPLTSKFRLEEGIIRGRCMFDVWESVDSDQTLLGNVKNNRLKTIARYRGFPAIEEELSNTIELLKDPPRLRRYNESDVLATLKLYAGYMYEHSTVANLIGFPYDEIINPKGARRGKDKTQKGRAREGITTLIGRIAGARGMGQGGFVEDGKNSDRYPEIFYDQSHLKATKRKAYYQGAIVGLFKDGKMLQQDEVLGEMYSPTMHADYCFAGDTDILTNEGWKNIEDIEVGTNIATLNTQNKQIEYQDVINTNTFHSQRAYHIKTQGVDQLITPNHRIIYHARNRNPNRIITGEKGNDEMWKDNYEIKAIKDLQDFVAIPHFGEWDRPGLNTINIGDYSFEANIFIEWLGWVITEGTIQAKIKGRQYPSIRIQQTKPENIPILKEVFDKLDIHFTQNVGYRESVNSYGTIYQLKEKEIHTFSIHNTKFVQLINQWMGGGIIRSGNKKIPRYLLDNMSQSQCRLLFDTMMKGDGCISSSHQTYETKSRQLADDFQELCLKAGYCASIRPYEQTHNNRKFPMFRINIQIFRRNVIRRRHVKYIPNFNDTTFCVTVPNGTVVSRRNGKVSVSGNSGMYPSIQMECNISPETTKLLALEPYDLSIWDTEGLVRERTDDYTIFVIPDKNLCGTGRNAIIYVDQSFEGSIPKFLRMLAKKRGGLKDLKKQAIEDLDEEGQLMYESGQYGLKVTANATGYGSNVRRETRWGSQACGILIPGISRFMLTLSQHFITSWKG